jgi:Ran GTPase-activating protein (RanGAP) involved in mRNA processing and transport
METKNTVQPDFTTGAEAIAELLAEPSCSLRCLDVSWNHVRLGSAVAMGEALKTNTSLTELNLEYNGLGVEGVSPCLA